MSAPTFYTLGSFAFGDSACFPALILGDAVYRLDTLEGGGWPTTLAIFEEWPRAATRLAQIAAAPPGGAMALSELRACAPVEPRQIICAGANYRKHVIDIIADHESASFLDTSPEDRRKTAEHLMDHRARHGQPYAFMKPVSCLLASSAELEIPADSTETDWELELAVVIGKPARRVRREHALSYVAGYTMVNDVSARDHIKRPDFPGLGMDWFACKGKPGFLPIGPTITPASFVQDPQNLMITLKLNGEVMQHESTADMIFPVARLIEFISTHMKLLPGDVICTGSPSGNGTHHKRFLRPGDMMDASITGFGSFQTRCVAEPLAPDAVLHRPFIPMDIH